MIQSRTITIILVIAILPFFFAEKRSDAKTVTDQMGRHVTVPKKPERIVSLAPSITEIIFALDQGHRLKGVTTYSDFPLEAQKLPKVGSYVQLDLEKIVALKPDLCIAIKDGNPIAVARRLESLKIPVYAVNPRNLETVIQTVQEIGGLLNVQKKADQLVQSMNRRIQQVKSLVAQTVYRPRVFFQIGVSPIVSVGTHTFSNELIVLAGGKNVAQGPIAYPRYSIEQVLALSPEVIIITSMARAAIFKQVKAQWNRWPSLPAVRNHRIYVEDSNLFDRPTPRLVEGLELMVRLIHPELFEGTK
ncbi:MAG: cobalamin-binding protein [Desulfobacterales bacterium]|jgi:iron complex transport system substrate-binding protein